MSAAILLPLFEDISPAPRPLPRPRHLTSAPPVRRGEILWLPGLAPAPTPPPAPPSRRPRVLAPPAQLALPFVRRLTLFPDILVATRGLCLHQQDECEEQDCRHHLGTVRTYLGDRFGCAVAVALAYPHGLAPVAVAELLGVGEGIAQITERGAYDKVRLELQREKVREWEQMERACRRHQQRDLATGQGSLLR